MLSPRHCSWSAAVVTLLALAGGASMPAFALPPQDPDASIAADVVIPSHAPASAVVEIDGRIVTVELSVTRAIGGAPGPNGPSITTSVAVQLSVNDGALLPDGLDAVGVRFEKLRGIKRFFFTPLTSLDFSVDNAAEGLGEEDFQNFIGDLSDRSQVQRLRATVRLEYNGQVFRVPVGVVRVNTLALP